MRSCSSARCALARRRPPSSSIPPGWSCPSPPATTPWPPGLQREIRKRLDAPPTLAQLAAPLNLSERTLRRRLEAAGTRYQALVDEARRDRALTLLGRADLALAEVAFQTGFGDLRNFRRAFRRWTGLAPQEARLRLKTRVEEAD